MLFRSGTPLLVQLFIIFYGLPSVGIMLDAFPAAVIAFAFNEGAYCAETMRGALESVPQGQLEAGYCLRVEQWMPASGSRNQNDEKRGVVSYRFRQI